MFSNLRRLKSSVENELISRTDNLLQHSRYPALQSTEVWRHKNKNVWNYGIYSDILKVHDDQKSLSYCNLGMRYWPFNAPVTPYKFL